MERNNLNLAQAPLNENSVIFLDSQDIQLASGTFQVPFSPCYGIAVQTSQAVVGTWSWIWRYHWSRGLYSICVKWEFSVTRHQEGARGVKFVSDQFGWQLGPRTILEIAVINFIMAVTVLLLLFVKRDKRVKAKALEVLQQRVPPFRGILAYIRIGQGLGSP
eukprot:Gb_25888 [translate_table: standard]